MGNINYVEELFLRVNTLIDQGDLAGAKELLEEILEIEPRYGRAYNHLAWLYAGQFRDYQKAEKLYRLGMRFSPNYPATYVNCIYLLLKLEKLDEAEALMQQATQVPGIDMATMRYQRGQLHEIRRDYRASLREYRAAREMALNADFMVDMEADIKRIRKKVGRLQATFL